MTTLVGIVHSGDSIAGGSSAGTDISYPYQAFQITNVGDVGNPNSLTWTTYYPVSPINTIFRDMAVSGSQLDGASPNLVGLAPIYIDPIIPVGYSVPPFDRIRKYIFSTAIGSNDAAIGGTNYTDYASRVALCCVARKTAGFNLIGMTTLLPRGDGGMLESDRLGYNGLLTNSSWRAANGIDFVIDLASQAIMGDIANCSDSTYYEQNGVNGYFGISGVHPTTAGHALLAPIYLAEINAAIAML